MCACNGGCGYEMLSDRIADLERELVEAADQRDQARIARLRARIDELRCGCRRLQETAA